MSLRGPGRKRHYKSGRHRPQFRLKQMRCEVQRPISEEERPTEDHIARRKLGPRGVPDGPDTAKMTPQEEKNIPKTGRFDGHTA
jgi:hypothetical protein